MNDDVRAAEAQGNRQGVLTEHVDLSGAGRRLVGAPSAAWSESA